MLKAGLSLGVWHINGQLQSGRRMKMPFWERETGAMTVSLRTCIPYPYMSKSVLIIHLIGMVEIVNSLYGK